MATRRKGLPYINASWLAKALGGAQCLFAHWFMAHFTHEKFQEEAFDLVRWNQEHNALMRTRRQELEREGWTVSVEEQNKFTLKGQVAVVSGKPDIIATKPARVLVVDGKTGRERDSDVWQVFLYLFAIQRARPELTGELTGEVQYARGDVRYTLTAADLDEPRMDAIVAMIRAIAGETPLTKVPSRAECKRCSIGPTDCKQRVMASDEQATLVSDF